MTTHKTWKTWTREGTPVTVHHTEVTNAAAKTWGRDAADFVSQNMARARSAAQSERVSAVQANMAMEQAAVMWGQ
jgi:hypothetical protein